MACAFLVALGLGACGPSDIDKTFTEGTHYGFTVGENAREAYAEFQRQILEGGHTSYDACEAQDADGAVAARGLAHMRLWKRPYLFGYRNERTLGPVRVPLDSFVVGLDSSRARLRRLMRDSTYDALEVSLRVKDFSKDYDPCLADPVFNTRRFIMDSGRVDTAVAWTLQYRNSSGCSDGVRLFLEDSVVVKLNRFRFCSQTI